jgi:glutamate synthase (ferredoxin)
MERVVVAVEVYRDRTGSPKAKVILNNWAEFLPKFWQVVPPSEADSPEANAEAVAEKVLTPVQ